MSAPTVLVTGGAGFVGSHTYKVLARAGYQPVVCDNLSNGVRDAVKWGPLEIGDLNNEVRLTDVIARHRLAGILHFVTSIEAGESIRKPERFYQNNVAGTLSLLRVMRIATIEKIVFSSIDVFYGEPEGTPIPETHLIPLAPQAAYGLRPEIAIFGTDYDTPDGTCTHDYVHVSDLAEAHVLALRRLLEGGDNLVANLGTGCGYSVREMIEAVENFVGLPVNVLEAPRRRRPGCAGRQGRPCSAGPWLAARTFRTSK